MGLFLPGCLLAALTLPRSSSELYDFDKGYARRYRGIIVQEAPTAVFSSVTASKEGAAHFLAGMGEPRLGMQGEGTRRTSEFRLNRL
jgi:hypothetical protein